MESTKHLAALESLLFISGEPLSIARLSAALGISAEEARTALEALESKYQNDGASGLMLVFHQATARLATKPAYQPLVEALTKKSLQENLSKAALEVLAIIAYRAPISRAEIETIRGVNCSFTLRNLLMRELIEREGNPEDLRGYVYGPSMRFLEVLGLARASELPDFAALSRDERLRVLIEGDQESAVPAVDGSAPGSSPEAS